jgi:hypothetical protein
VSGLGNVRWSTSLSGQNSMLSKPVSVMIRGRELTSEREGIAQSQKSLRESPRASDGYEAGPAACERGDDATDVRSAGTPVDRKVRRFQSPTNLRSASFLNGRIQPALSAIPSHEGSAEPSLAQTRSLLVVMPISSWTSSARSLRIWRRSKEDFDGDLSIRRQRPQWTLHFTGSDHTITRLNFLPPYEIKAARS